MGPLAVPPYEETNTSHQPKLGKPKAKRTPNKLKHIPSNLLDNSFVRLKLGRTEPYPTSRHTASSPIVAVSEARRTRRPNSSSWSTKTASDIISKENPPPKRFPSPSQPTMPVRTPIATAPYGTQFIASISPYSTGPMGSFIPSVQYDPVSRSSSISSGYIRSPSSSSSYLSAIETSHSAGVYDTNTSYPSYQGCDAQELNPQFNVATENSRAIWTYKYPVTEGGTLESSSGSSIAQSHFTRGHQPDTTTQSCDDVYHHPEVERDPHLFYQNEEPFLQIQHMNPLDSLPNFPLNTYHQGSAGKYLSENTIPGSSNYQLHTQFYDTVDGEGH